MIRNETRESAHLRSRVKDLSVVPNIVSYTALLAAITPLAKLKPTTDGLYEPILIRDVDSLIANFGDPKIDPEKYIDLYSIMQLVSNGTSCYVAKVPSGNTGEYDLKLIPIETEDLSNKLLERSPESGGDAENTSWSLDNLKSSIYTVTSVSDTGTPIPSSGIFGTDTTFTVVANSYPDLNNYKLHVSLDTDYALKSEDFEVKVSTEDPVVDATVLAHLVLTLNSEFSTNAFTKRDLCSTPMGISLSKDGSNFSLSGTADISGTHITISGTNNGNTIDQLFGGNLIVKVGDSQVASFTIQLYNESNELVDVSNLSNTTSASDPISLSDQTVDHIKFLLKDANDTSVGNPVSCDYNYGDAFYSIDGTIEVGDAGINKTALCSGVIKLSELTSPSTEIELNGYVEYTEYDADAVAEKFTQKFVVDEETGKFKLVLKCKQGDANLPVGDLKIISYTPVAELQPSTPSENADVTELKLQGLKSDKYAIKSIKKQNGEEIYNYVSKPDFIKEENSSYTLVVKAKEGAFNASIPLYIELAPSDTVLHIDSSMADKLNIGCKLTQAKPYPLKLFYLEISVATEEGNLLGKAKVKLDENLTNQSLVNTINSSIGAYTRFRLEDTNSSATNSIVQGLLNKYAPFDSKGVRQDLENKSTELQRPLVIDDPSFKVSLDEYSKTLAQYKDRKYVGCLMADMVCPVTESLYEGDDKVTVKYVKELSSTGMDKWPRGTATSAIVEVITETGYAPLTPSERRSLHYNMKQVACERKDTTVILSTPYNLGISVSADKSDNNVKVYTYDTTEFTLDEICEWVSATGSFVDLWEYGEADKTDYALQSFYLEMYYTWLNMKCTKIDNGLAKSVTVNVAPANLVIENILRSWRERGVQYPVAGDQYGTLPETCTVLKNPKTKLDRDQLVQYRINPIYDTGTRGVQIYGNETLNPGYTDLNAAHIARTLVYIRSTIDEYTEKLKFSINSLVLWDTWKSYVSQYILEPLKAANALAEYVVAMGEDTTTAEEIANRIIKGQVSLRFYQSAEVFDLTYNIYSSATTLDEAMSNS